jgi:5'-3' exoribonuclease 2
VYKRILPTLGDYITNHGGQVNLSHVDVILAEVGSIEDYVFAMKHENEQREKKRREEFNARKKQAKGRSLDVPPPISSQPKPKVMGRAARILEKQQENEKSLKKQGDAKIKSSHMKAKDNVQAAIALKHSLNSHASIKGEDSLNSSTGIKKEDRPSTEDIETLSTRNVVKDEDVVVKVEDKDEAVVVKGEEDVEMRNNDGDGKVKGVVVKGEEDVEMCNNDCDSKVKSESGKKRKLEDFDTNVDEAGVGIVGDAEEEFAEDDDEDDDEDAEPIALVIDEDVSPEVASAFKERVQTEQKKKLDEYAKTVDDKVRLHEAGWKDRYYSDKCKADDVANHGGREHLFRSYIMGLCWVMKYYYEGCKCVFLFFVLLAYIQHI